ncbi:copper chaperone PCu(A)C [Stappia sp. P2PMeth1]|uniref:copper chaperone PCu(A)C n=1 Tax=Stappia sp. P2PMeth1 TaxID=2003586 RepID=UPI0016486E35|nr:copper chaperone PCu(A)C [Stappia sp. P2PMeth1]
MKPTLHLLLLAVVAVPSITVESSAREIQVSHENSAKMLQIEHAEVLISSSNTSLRTIYLTIWNGTTSSENLIGVESDSFTGVTVFRNTFGRRERMNSVLTIPAHAELKMVEPGVHLALDGFVANPLQPNTMPLTLRFERSGSITVNAKIVQDRSELTHHRHGEQDTPSE